MYNLKSIKEYFEYLEELNELLENDPKNEELLYNFNGYIKEIENSLNNLKKSVNS